MKKNAEIAPLYARIAGVLRQRIETGSLAVGSMLPTLESYMREFAASRVTMRLAMDMLDSEGLIARRRGVGTTVIAAPHTARKLNLPMSWHELLARLNDVKRSYISSSIDETPTREALNDSIQPSREGLSLANVASSARSAQNQSTGPQQRKYAHIKALHRHNNKAYCVVDAWIDRRIFDASEAALQTRPALVVLMEFHASEVNTVTQTLTLEIADVDVASVLSVPLGSPLAVVRRTVFNATNERIYAAQIYFPASVVRIDTQLFEH
jgi:GntR family transcriptional regulator